MVLESGLLAEQEDRYVLMAPLPPLAIPSTLQDSLMARLDRLAAVKEVAQLGAALGRAFPYELIRAVSHQDDTTLNQALARLVDAELLYQRGVPPQATYIFKHALVQEAAYQSVLKSIRQQSHQRIAQVLEARFPEIRETRPEFLAHHYTEAGLPARAIPYWHRAGQRAIENSAHLEAINHLTKGLESLATLPNTPERARQELGFLTTLGLALTATKGQANEEVGRTYTRAREISQQLGETPQLLPALSGLVSFHIVRAELEAARQVGEQLLDLAERQSAASLFLVAHWALGQPCSSWESRARRESTWNREFPSTPPGNTTLWRASPAFPATLESSASALPLILCVIWAIPIRRARGSAKHSPWLESWRTPTVWRCLWIMRPCCISSAARGDWLRSRQRQPLHSAQSRGSPTTSRGEP
jgi:hypothetical protein